MKDLKHLYELERLLEDANNDLVRKARSEGRKCVATVCENVPEPLLNLPGTFSVRLRAPRTGSMEMATYYMTSFLCEYTRALLERAMEGGYNFTDCLITPDGCTMLNRCIENMELLHTMEKPDFFYEYMEIPMKNDENGLNLYTLQCRNHVLTPLHERFGIDVSDGAIRQARGRAQPRLSVDPGHWRISEGRSSLHYRLRIPYPDDGYLCGAEEHADSGSGRDPGGTENQRTGHKEIPCPVVLVGSEVDDVDVVKLIEDCGAYVCADRFCYGSFPGRDEIILTEDEDALTQICRQYMNRAQCARYMNQEKIQGRRAYVAKLAEDYHADGIIYEQMKFCDPWAYERTVGTQVLRDEYHYPVLSVDRPYAVGHSGQLRTRVQAFVESIEIKKIQGGGK